MRAFVSFAAAAAMCGCFARDPYARMASELARPFEDGKMRLAVLPFKGVASDADEEGSAAAERLISRLVGRKGIELVERTRIAEVLQEPKLALSGAVSAESTRAIGRLVGADAVVVGSVIRGRDSVEVEARVVEVESGRMLSASHLSLPRRDGPAIHPARPPSGTPTRMQPPPRREPAEYGRTTGPGPDLPAPVGDGAVMAAGGRLYVAGGSRPGLPSGRGLAEVVSAPVGRDGRVGPWRTEEPLPGPRYRTAGTAYGGRLFLVGGYDGAPRSDVFSARLGPDGRLERWTRAGQLPMGANSCSAAASAGVLVVGGCAVAQGSDRLIHAAVIQADGSLGPWASVAPPEPMSHAAVVLAGERLFLMGGYSDGPPLKSAVYSAPLRPDGTFGEFRREEPLPAPMMLFGAGEVSGRILVVGGWAGAVDRVSDAVYAAEVGPEGRLGRWRTEPGKLPMPRAPHGLAVWGGRAFVVGNYGPATDRVVVLPDGLVGGKPGAFGTLPNPL